MASGKKTESELKLEKIKYIIMPYVEDCGAVSTSEILDDILEVING